MDLEFKEYLTKFIPVTTVRIATWGDDDFGVELDFIGSIEEMEGKFKIWKEEIYDRIPEPCNKKYFYDLGFVNA